ncbi:MAG: 2,3-bisphosphoglycerate-independent phosphoglycerate mutase, partial [Bacteroidota bacterium]
GRIVYQELARINNAIKEDTLKENPILKETIQYLLEDKSRKLHLLGLWSDGGVHSHINHAKALTEIFENAGCDNIFLHAFTDGRDTDPNNGKAYLQDFQDFIKDKHTEIASVCGRYYAMDRDSRWERIQLAYDALVNGKGELIEDLSEAIQKRYDAGETDEFLKPMILNQNAKVEEGDAVLFFNFRTDRPRQLTQALSQKDFPDFGMSKRNVRFVTMTNYDSSYEDAHIVFEKDTLKNTIGEVLAKHQKSQTRIAETEKYPHVTFFFNGGREEAFENEERILIPSPKMATYDLKPEMSAIEIKEAIMENIAEQVPDFICLNFANTDMVGHTGDFNAAMIAANTVDQCVSEIVPLALDKGYDIFVIADHGNADFMINEDGSPHTAHTTNLVPCIYLSYNDQYQHIKDGKLADIAPSILHVMGVDIPEEMNGEILLYNE